MATNRPRGLRLEDLRPHSISSGRGEQTETVSFRVSGDVLSQLEDLTIRLKPRFKNKGDLVRTALVQFMEELAEEIGDNLTLSVVQRERVLSDLAFHAENRKWLAETLESFEIGLWQMLQEKQFQKAHDMMVEFVTAGTDVSDFTKLFWRSERVRSALVLVRQMVRDVSPVLESPVDQAPLPLHLAS